MTPSVLAGQGSIYLLRRKTAALWRLIEERARLLYFHIILLSGLSEVLHEPISTLSGRMVQPSFISAQVLRLLLWHCKAEKSVALLHGQFDFD